MLIVVLDAHKEYQDDLYLMLAQWPDSGFFFY